MTRSIKKRSKRGAHRITDEQRHAFEFPHIAELVRLSRQMAFHRIAPVSVEPSTRLTQWQIALVRDDQGKRTRHMVGWAEYEGRVSSPITSFDPKTGVAFSLSGRRYQLSGPSGRDRDADYVWERWKRATGVKMVRYSTQAFERLLARHQTSEASTQSGQP